LILVEIFSCVIVWFLLSTRFFLVYSENLNQLSRQVLSSLYRVPIREFKLLVKYKSLNIGVNYAIAEWNAHTVFFSAICMAVWAIVYFCYSFVLGLQQGENMVVVAVFSFALIILVWMFWIMKQAVEFTRLSDVFISALLPGNQMIYRDRERQLWKRICKSLVLIQLPLGIFHRVTKHLLMVLAGFIFEFTVNFMLIRGYKR